MMNEGLIRLSNKLEEKDLDCLQKVPKDLPFQLIEPSSIKQSFDFE
jgi:hypothetical protein